METKVGFIGFGEAGFHMAAGLGREGLKGINAFDVALDRGGSYADTVKDRAARAEVGLALSPKALAEASTIIFCAVQAQYAEEVAASVLTHIRPGTLYVDVTTALPAQKKAIADTFAARELSYIDGAMMGSLPTDEHRVATYCSGVGADRLCALMNAFNMLLSFTAPTNCA